MKIREDMINVSQGQQDARAARGIAMAAVISAIPLYVWGFVLILLFFFIALAVGLHVQDMPSFMDSVLHWILWGIVAGVVLLLMRLIRKALTIYHEEKTRYQERLIGSATVQRQRALAEKAELQNEELRARIDLMRQLPQVALWGAQAGLNVTIDAKAGTVQVANYLSNVHTISGPAGPAGLLNMPGPRQIGKPTMQEVIQAIEPNSFEICIGRNLTTGEFIKAELLDRHIKVIGASRMGKSCLIGSILESLRQTHEPTRLKLAILDLEDVTGRLFEGDPHILQAREPNGRIHQFHARNHLEVAQQIILLERFMTHRYTLIAQQGYEYVDRLPRVLIYFEEFLAWKSGLDLYVPDKQLQEQAIAAVIGLATRGLKVGLHLMISAQVNYADKDLISAMAQFVGINVSFAVIPTAARAAGFLATDLLAQNFADKTPGQFVVEMIGGADMGLSPDFDVRAMVKALPRRAESLDQGAPSRSTGPLFTEVDTEPDLSTQVERVTEPRATQEERELALVVDAWRNGHQSIRKVAAATGLGENRSRTLIAKAEFQGLIEEK